MKLLIADDDRVFQGLLKRMVTRWGYDPVVVSDGEAAWRELSAHDGPALAILDWMIPELDGIEVCRRVRSNNRSRYVYLILLTGKIDAKDLVIGLEAGADDYLPKPIRLDELRLRLRSGCRVLEAEERQRVFAENASDGVISIEERAHIRFANRSVGAIFGYGAEELFGRDFSLLIPHFQQHLGDHPQLSETTENLRSWPPQEIAGKHATGRDLLLEVSFSEFVDNRQKNILTAVIRDMTERRLLERQLAQAQKLESIGQLAAGIAHEINTPIQYIGDNARFLQDAFRDLVVLVESSPVVARATDGDVEYFRSEVPKAIGELIEGVDQVARIVRAMKEFSHPGPVEKTPIDINRAIESTIVVSRNEWKYVADVTTDLDHELPPVPCMAGEFNQVILNLIVNAAHAIADATKDSGVKGEIHISTSMGGPSVEIRVSDTGCGIPEAIRSKVFDPFFTTKPVGKGTGQGLAIAHSVIVQKHGGSIQLESEPGRGTTFVIQLPLACELEAV